MRKNIKTQAETNRYSLSFNSKRKRTPKLYFTRFPCVRTPRKRQKYKKRKSYKEIAGRNHYFRSSKCLSKDRASVSAKIRRNCYNLKRNRGAVAHILKFSKNKCIMGRSECVTHVTWVYSASCSASKYGGCCKWSWYFYHDVSRPWLADK